MILVIQGVGVEVLETRVFAQLPSTAHHAAPAGWEGVQRSIGDDSPRFKAQGILVRSSKWL